jgi:small subunit ribosomal protein S17
MTDGASRPRGVRKERTGKVISKSGAQSVVVLVERRKPHPFYGKVVRHRKKYHAHDEQNAASVGDSVRIVECRPLSRLKRWRVVEVATAEKRVE